MLAIPVLHLLKQSIRFTHKETCDKITRCLIMIWMNLSTVFGIPAHDPRAIVQVARASLSLKEIKKPRHFTESTCCILYPSKRSLDTENSHATHPHCGHQTASVDPSFRARSLYPVKRDHQLSSDEHGHRQLHNLLKGSIHQY